MALSVHLASFHDRKISHQHLRSQTHLYSIYLLRWPEVASTWNTETYEITEWYLYDTTTTALRELNNCPRKTLGRRLQHAALPSMLGLKAWIQLCLLEAFGWLPILQSSVKDCQPWAPWFYVYKYKKECTTKISLTALLLLQNQSHQVKKINIGSFLQNWTSTGSSWGDLLLILGPKTTCRLQAATPLHRIKAPIQPITNDPLSNPARTNL